MQNTQVPLSQLKIWEVNILEMFPNFFVFQVSVCFSAATSWDQRLAIIRGFFIFENTKAI